MYVPGRIIAIEKSRVLTPETHALKGIDETNDRFCLHDGLRDELIFTPSFECSAWAVGPFLGGYADAWVAAVYPAMRFRSPFLLMAVGLVGAAFIVKWFVRSDPPHARGPAADPVDAQDTGDPGVPEPPQASP